VKKQEGKGKNGRVRQKGRKGMTSRRGMDRDKED